MIRTLKALIVHPLIKKEDGVALVEYALLLALIALVCIAAIVLVGGNANNTLSTAATSL
jgi:pilus assembly protein Flp/PilA